MQELFKGVDWKETAVLNSLRAICAGLVLALLMWLFPGSTPTPIGTLLAIGLGFVFMYWLFLFPIGYVAAKLSEMGVPWVGMISLIFSLMIVLGDPIVFLLKFTKKLPISPDFAPFNFSIIFLVLRDDVATVHSVG